MSRLHAKLSGASRSLSKEGGTLMLVNQRLPIVELLCGRVTVWRTAHLAYDGDLSVAVKML
jgi:ABC-type multidrug transport system ATPase subunit